MPLEFPAVSQSRVEFWGQPQFTQKGMLWFTLLFGAFGLHHFYLRSPQTGLLFLLGNILTLGYFYFYDVLQLSTKTYEELQEFGLDLPWSAAGIAQGMWKAENKTENESEKPKGPFIQTLKRFKNSFTQSYIKEPQEAQEAQGEQKTQTGGAEPNEPPDPIWFFLYSLLLPMAPLARLAAGDTQNALLALMNLTIIPLGFLFLAASVMYEYFMLFAKPADVLYNGVRRIFPFTKLGYSEYGFSPRLTGRVNEEAPCEDDNFAIRVVKGVLRAVLPAPIVATFDTAVATAQTTKEQVIDKGVAVAQQAVETGTRVVNTATKVANIATQVPGALASATKTIQNATAKAPEVIQAKLNMQLPVSPSLTNLKPQPVNQTGGGQLTSMDKWAVGGVLAAILSGFVLHTGRSFYHAVQDVRSPSDLPPR